eukprot:8351324-Pyramimonas_sp.AAC.1
MIGQDEERYGLLHIVIHQITFLAGTLAGRTVLRPQEAYERLKGMVKRHCAHDLEGHDRVHEFGGPHDGAED